LDHPRYDFATGKEGAHQVDAKTSLPIVQAVLNQRSDGAEDSSAVDQDIGVTKVVNELM
jgi:hypothetical protein